MAMTGPFYEELRHEASRFLSLWGGALQCGGRDTLSLPDLLLLNLPQDCRRWGYAINLGTDSRTLEVEGSENLRVYNAKLYDRGAADEVPASEAERNFCGLCGSFLWLFSPSYPELVHPFASAIDTPLPKPPERVRIMLEFAAPWCEIPPEGTGERHSSGYPEESLVEWHRRHGLYDERST